MKKQVNIQSLNTNGKKGGRMEYNLQYCEKYGD